MRKHFPAVLTLTLLALVAVAAIPRTAAIPHASPERFSGITYFDNFVKFSGGTGRIESDVFVDGGLVVGGTAAEKVVVGHLQQDGGRPAYAVETYLVTLSGGTATVTFAEAFSSAPICTCSDTATTAAAANCSGASTTQVVPKGGASAQIGIVCVGPR